MAVEFPFLQLPFLSQLDVIDRMEFFDFLSFSLTSKKSKEKCMQSKYPVTSWTWRWNLLDLVLNVATPEGFMVLRFLTTTFGMQDDDEFDELTINEDTVEVRRASAWEIRPVEGVSRVGAVYFCKQFTKHIMAIVKTNKFKVELYNPCPPDNFIWSTRSSFSSVLLPRTLAINVDDLKWMLANLNIEDMQVLSLLPQEFTYSGCLKSKNLTVGTSRWIPLDTLLNMECENVHILNGSLSFQKLRTIIQKWLDGGLPNLKSIKCWISQNDKEQAERECLDGLQTNPYNGLRRPRRLILNGTELDLTRGIDIRRDDGRLATLDTNTAETLIFVIW